MSIHHDDPTLILMSIPYCMSYDAGLHTLEQPRIRQWLKNYEKKQITLPTTEDRLEKERQKRLHAEEYRQKLLAVIPGMFRKWEPILGVQSAKVTIRPTPVSYTHLLQPHKVLPTDPDHPEIPEQASARCGYKHRQVLYHR